MERKRIRPWILRFAWSAAPCGLGLAAALTAAAQTPVPAGSEFQINTYTTNRQQNPSVAVGADGDFVVVWQSYGSSGTDSPPLGEHSVQGQRFSVPEPSLPLSCALAGAVVALLARRTRGHPTTVPRRSGRRAP